MYITSLEIENLRVFEKAKLGFQYPGKLDVNGGVPAFPNVNLLLGNNGQGKSTVLRAIALSAVSSILGDSGYVPYSMVRRKPGIASSESGFMGNAVLQGTFVLHGQDVGSKSDTLDEGPFGTRVVIERKTDLERIRHEDSSTESDGLWEAMYDNDSPAFLVVGYGATRRVEEQQNYDAASRKRTALRYHRVAGLFQESFSLIPLERWLPNLESRNPGRFEQVVHLIDKLLEKPFRFVGRRLGGEYYLEQGDAIVPVGALSDGYRAYLGWISDLLYHICTGCPSGKKLIENKGIVMVDEVDLHLHPSWQRTVVPTLANTFPNLQFILTTHSPIITGSLHAENIWVMKNEDGSSEIVEPKSSVHGLSADQILISDYFGMDTSRTPGMQQRMRELNVRALKGDKDASLQMLQCLAEGLEGDDGLVPVGTRIRKKAAKKPGRSSALRKKPKKTGTKGSAVAKKKRKTVKSKATSAKRKKRKAKKKR